jgi:hypothetical protein
MKIYHHYMFNDSALSGVNLNVVPTSGAHMDAKGGGGGIDYSKSAHRTINVGL